jgi:hypothetical protein
MEGYMRKIYSIFTIALIAAFLCCGVIWAASPALAPAKTTAPAKTPAKVCKTKVPANVIMQPDEVFKKFEKAVKSGNANDAAFYATNDLQKKLKNEKEFKAMRDIIPADYKIIKKETGKEKAILSIEGTEKAGKMHGTVVLKIKNGKWNIDRVERSNPEGMKTTKGTTTKTTPLKNETKTKTTPTPKTM